MTANLLYKFVFLTLILLLQTMNFAVEEKLLITGNEARAPKIFLDDNQQPKGYLVEVMNLIAKELKIPVEYKLQHWPKAVDDAMSAKYAIIGFSRSNERMKIFDFTEEPLYYDKVILVTTKNNNMKFETYEDLKNKKIAAIRGTNYGFIFEKLVKEKGFHYVETFNVESQLELLVKNKIDAFLIGAGIDGFKSAIKNVKNQEIINKINEFRFLKKPFNLDPNYLAIHKSRNKKEFLNKIDEVIKKLKADGKLNHIFEEK